MFILFWSNRGKLGAQFHLKLCMFSCLFDVKSRDNQYLGRAAEENDKQDVECAIQSRKFLFSVSK